MKHLLLTSVSLGLIASLLFATTIKSWIKVSYEFNKAEITALFCVNKDKPKLHCEGKCHLNKTLKEVENSEEKKNNDEEKTVQLQLQLFLNQINEIYFQQVDVIKSSVDFSSLLYHYLFSNTILRPPISD